MGLMRVKVNNKHESEGTFPLFKAETNVLIKDKCDGFFAWYSCEIEGYSTYIHEDYFENGKLVTDYNPTELDAEPGDVLEVLLIKNNWLYCKTEDEIFGWIPGDNVKTI